MKLRKQVGLGLGHIVLDGEPLPFQKGHNPQFSAHVRCGQTAGWIKKPLGTEVGLGPGDFVLDGDPAHPSKKSGGASFPIFGTCLLWSNGWMHKKFGTTKDTLRSYSDLSNSFWSLSARMS